MPEPPTPPGAARTSLAFATCTLIWGSTFLFIRIGNDTVPPLWAATLRLVIAAVVMVALVRALGRRLPRGPALRAAAWYGLFQFGFNVPLLYWGELVVPSGPAAVVYATVPITSALITRAFGLERLDPLKMLGGLVALGGVIMLFAGRLGARVTALPVLSIYLATVFAALGSTLLKRGPRQDPLAANAVAAAIGAPVCLLGSVMLREARPLPAHWGQIYPILYLAIFGSVGAFVVFAWLVNHWNVSTIAFIGVVVPVIAVGLGALVRHEELRREHLMGSVLVLAGVVLAIASDRRASRPPASS
jgi:drug/metabolite transporter (DMT)-like permease